MNKIFKLFVLLFLPFTLILSSCSTSTPEGTVLKLIETSDEDYDKTLASLSTNDMVYDFIAYTAVYSYRQDYKDSIYTRYSRTNEDMAEVRGMGHVVIVLEKSGSKWLISCMGLDYNDLDFCYR